MDEVGRKVVFLDRDGVINIDHGFVHKWANWQWAPGAKEGLAVLNELPYDLVVVTNQSGINNGYYRLEDMVEVHKRMESELKKEGVIFAAIVYCPHRDDEGCGCRKPKTGMAEMAEESVGKIDYKNSWVVGDKEKDMNFGRSLGTKTVLVRSRYWQEGDVDHQPDLIVDSLLEAAEFIRESKKK
jgi:D-glycero-D-manno-heptose 1,7-bisphosphate phosphatase